MSEHGGLQFVWDIMEQSEWWKQYSDMVNRSHAETRNYEGSDLSMYSGSGSYTGFWMGSELSSYAGSGAELWWTSFESSGWSSFIGSAGYSSAGSGISCSGSAFGYGLQLL